jgi:hypothetical protein
MPTLGAYFHLIGGDFYLFWGKFPFNWGKPILAISGQKKMGTSFPFLWGSH